MVQKRTRNKGGQKVSVLVLKLCCCTINAPLTFVFKFNAILFTSLSAIKVSV